MVPRRRHRLTPAAEKDVEDIWLYTARQWTPVRANQYVREFLTAFADLASGERAGTPVLAGQDYYRLLVGSHVIVYRVSDTRIDVIRILHQSVDLPRHLT
jgi:toxin ParE1/3/4